MRGITPAVVTAVVLALSAPAYGGPPSPQIVDARGDANGVNHQGWLDLVGVPDPSRPTEPASYAAGDVLSVRWGVTYARRRVSALTVTLTLGAAPAEGLSYLIKGDARGCDGPLRVSYDTIAGERPTASIGCGGLWLRGAYAVVSGARIVWTVPLAALRGRISQGDVLTRLEADSWAGAVAHHDAVPPEHDYGGARLVVVDQASSTRTFRVG